MSLIDRIVEHPLGDDPPKARLIYGRDVRESLRALDAGSVHMVATSPPYWGLRDYGGDPPTWNDGWVGHLGSEPTPKMFVAHLVEVFGEVRRVLRTDGVAWLNLGDTYFGSSTSSSNHSNLGKDMVAEGRWPVDKSAGGENPNHKNTAWPGARDNPEAYSYLKPKDLVGIPWMAAFALREAGWYLRMDVVWNKPNPMPEPVRDRPTKAHEYIFLLGHPDSKGRYYYDREAIREPVKASNKGSCSVVERQGGTAFDEDGKPKGSKREYTEVKGANRRSVWNINPKPYPGAHFATWPEDLVELMVKASTSEGGCCAACGAPRRRVEDVTPAESGREPGGSEYSQRDRKFLRGGAFTGRSSTTVGWAPSCECDAETIPATVMDIFSGSATTGAVAMKFGRDYLGLDLQPDYFELAEARLRGRKAPKASSEDDEVDLIGGLFG